MRAILYTIGVFWGRSGNIFEALNYLAHFYLAHPDEPLMFGNYIGDGVKGRIFRQFPDEIQRGILYHRFIDSYTDSHPEVLAAKKLFYPTQGKFSPVVVDVIFDHLLALHWDRYHPESLPGFAAFCHSVIDWYSTHLPERSARFYHYMVRESLLENYGTENGIETVLRRMDSRTNFASNMSRSLQDIRPQRPELQDRFDRFFPDLISKCEQWKQEHGIL